MAVAIVVLCLACAPMASAAGAGAGAKRTFPDVNASTPHAEDIAWLAETGISTGFPDGTFRGGDAVTRQDMAAFLRRLARLMGDESAAESKTYTCSFKDVTDATPHADDIAWLAETGISTGYPDNTFRGMAAVCRQDMAAFLRRLAAREGVGDAASWDGEPGGFPDVGATADHAADIAWLAATGVSTGYPDGTFRGMAAVARQDMAAFLHRLNKLSCNAESALCALYSDGSLIISTSRDTNSSKKLIDSWQGLGTTTWYEKKAQYKNRIKSITVNGRVKAPFDFTIMGDGVFQHLPHLTSLDLKELDMSETVFCSSMLYGCDSLQSIDLSNKDLGTLKTFSLGAYGIKNVSFAHSDLHNLYVLQGFYNNSSIEYVDLSNCDLSSMSNWSQMFQGSSLRAIKLSGAKLAEYCEFDYMFADCPHLFDVDLSFANSPSARTLTCMFASCPKIKQLDLSRISPARNQWGGRIETPSMFANCTSLQTITGIDTWELGDDAWTANMFDGCPAPRPPWYTESAIAA